MRKAFSIMVGILISFQSSFSFAANYSYECKDVRAAAVQESLRALEEVKSWIERVPPDEANYLSEEYGASFRAGSRARLDALTRRPYYRAWQLHKSIDEALIEVQLLSTLQDASLKQRIQAAAFLPHRLSEVTEAFSAYLDQETAVTQEIRNKRGVYVLTVTELYFAHYIKCTAELIKD